MARKVRSGASRLIFLIPIVFTAAPLWAQTGACCDASGACTVTEEAACAGSWLGAGTDCAPNCCLQAPTGSDCVCDTYVCIDDGTQASTGVLCDGPGDASCGSGFTCTLGCTPSGVTTLRHPYECFDATGPLSPSVPCDPDNGDADCTSLDPLYTCGQSHTTTWSDTLTGTIQVDFTRFEGDFCSINNYVDSVGWYELFELQDRTPGDTTDDCFVLTADHCCSDPVAEYVWPFVVRYDECPCTDQRFVVWSAPDENDAGEPLAGFGLDSLSHFPCEDGNYSATFVLPPGQYGYQLSGRRVCEGSVTGCDSDMDCPGTPCVLPDSDYTLHFTIESCDTAACCLGGTCMDTNRLDCAARGGVYLGDAVPPVSACPPGIDNPCLQGSCCQPGACLDDSAHDEQAECDAAGGVFVGSLGCTQDPCPVCLFDDPANCQQVQTIYGPVPPIDRNPANGSGGNAVVTADDFMLNGTTIDQICWNIGFFSTPCCGLHCVQDIDGTWEIRIYEDGGGIPGSLVGMSSVTVLNKIEGMGNATGTWQYSGSVDTPIDLPNGGAGGDVYWWEVSGFGTDGCEIHAIHSRDDGNRYSAYSTSENPLHTYASDQIRDYDLAFCEDSGLTTPAPALGACCTCPAICTSNVTYDECVNDLRGRWTVGGTCDPNPCPGVPANDDQASATVITGVPDPFPGGELVLQGNNICATDDGPPLRSAPFYGCSSSIAFVGEMHDDVWYSYTTEMCGELAIYGCGDTDFDQMIAVYDARTGLPVTTDDEIACDDDGCGVGVGPSSLVISTDPPEELLIRVGGWNDEVPGGNNGNPRGTFTLHLQYISIPRGAGFSPCPIWLEPPAPPDDVLKNRYISLRPDPFANDHHLRVQLIDTQVAGVTAIGSIWWANEPDENCISIVGPTQPPNEIDWSPCSTLHLTGCPIIPTSTYEVVGVHNGSSAGSTRLVLQTQARPGVKWWGDCVGFFNGTEWTPPQGTVNIDDAFAAIKAWQFPGGPAAPPLTWVDVHPNLPGTQINKHIGFNDVYQIVQGFKGSEYPNPDIHLCPDP